MVFSKILLKSGSMAFVGLTVASLIADINRSNSNLPATLISRHGQSVSRYQYDSSRGTSLERSLALPDNSSVLAVHPEGSEIIYTDFRDLYRTNIFTGNTYSLGNFSFVDGMNVVWTPSDRIFISYGNIIGEVIDNELVEVQHFDGTVILEDVNFDGTKYIIRYLSGNGGFMVFDINDGIIADFRNDQFLGLPYDLRWIPNSDFYYFSTVGLSNANRMGSSAVNIGNITTGETFVISPGGSNSLNPVVSPDGQTLVYEYWDHVSPPRLMGVDLSMGFNSEVIAEVAMYPRFINDGTLEFQRPESNENPNNLKVFQLDLANGEITETSAELTFGEDYIVTN